MSVPTSLQGTHDGCGGGVLFRPAEHAHDLLAGLTVQLTGRCGRCGSLLSTAWALPQAAVARRESLEALPLAAGAESWSGGGRGHQGRANEPRGRAALSTVPPASDPAPAPAPVDPVLDAHLSKFADRIQRARTDLQRMNVELPSAVAAAAATAMRTPQLARPGVAGESSAAPRSAAPTLAQAPMRQPTPAPRAAVQAAPAPAAPAPTLPSPALSTRAPAAPTHELLSSSIFTAALRSAPTTDPAAAPSPLPSAVPDPGTAARAPLQAAATAVAQPTPSMPAPAAAPAQARPLAPREIAPTDSDVFPPHAQPAAAPVLTAAMGAGPELAPQLAAGAPAMDDIWATRTGAAVVAPSAPAPQPTSAPAVEHAHAPTPTPAGAPAPQLVPDSGVDGVPGEPDADLSVAFEPNRGFDWSGAEPDEKPARRAKRQRPSRRAKGSKPTRARSSDELDAGALPPKDSDAATAPATPRAAAGTRVRLGMPEIAVVVVLAAISGVAGMKLVVSDDPATLATAGATAAPVVPSAAGTTAARTTTTAAAKARAATRAKAVAAARAKAVTAARARAAAAAKAKAAETARSRAAAAAKATAAAASEVPGTTVAALAAPAPTSALAEAAAATTTSAAPPAVQEHATPADTAPAAAQSETSSNPFARP